MLATVAATPLTMVAIKSMIITLMMRMVKKYAALATVKIEMSVQNHSASITCVLTCIVVGTP